MDCSPSPKGSRVMDPMHTLAAGLFFIAACVAIWKNLPAKVATVERAATKPDTPKQTITVVFDANDANEVGIYQVVAYLKAGDATKAKAAFDIVSNKG